MKSKTLTDTQISEFITHLNEHGYCIIKNLLSDDNAQKLNSIADFLFNEVSKGQTTTPPVGRQKTIANDPIVNNAINYNDDLLNLCTSGDYLSIYKYFLNDPYYQLIDDEYPNFILAQCNLRKGASALDYHVDVRMNVKGLQSWSMQGIIAFDERGSNNGGLNVIPGSHLLDYFPSSNIDKSNEIKINLARGDMVIFFSSLFHSTTSVAEGFHPAWGFLLTYRCWWCKPQFDFVRMLSETRKSRLSNLQKTLIGCHSLPSNDPKSTPSARTGY